MTEHHPDLDVLVEYSAGVLSPAMALCVNIHLKYCPHCREQLARLDSLAGEVFAMQESSPVSEGLFDRIMGRIDAEAAPKVIDESQTARYQTRKLLRPWVPEGFSGIDWKPQWFKMYEHVMQIEDHGRIRLALQKISAGGTAPVHGHYGREVTVVLEGAFSDASGTYREGDFIIREAGEEHQPRVHAGQDCVCLTLLEGPVQLTGVWGQWVERLRRFFFPDMYPVA